jgi:pyridinium-3,5-bisthiocarboxylic acid mononucleotide nickel chelatase
MLIAYIDCYAGLSGESLLDALVSAGLPRTQLSTAFVVLSAVSDKDSSLLASFDDAISASALPPLAKQVTRAVLARLREAEASVYASSMQSVFRVTGLRSWDLTELSALAGIVYGLSLLGVDRVVCSPLRVGGGSVEADANLTPALSPIAAELLRAGSVPIYGSDQTEELVTPIGAALVATLATRFGPIPTMKIHSIGYGIEQTSGSGLYVTSLDGRLCTPSRQTRIFVGEALGPDLAPASSSLDTASMYRAPSSSTVEAGRATPIEAAATATTQSANPYVDSLSDWIAISIKGHQESGRQRL